MTWFITPSSLTPCSCGSFRIEAFYDRCSECREKKRKDYERAREYMPRVKFKEYLAQCARSAERNG